MTVTTTHRPATDLGYLLHKHPDRVQRFEQSFGTVTVCYPEASEERCTAALLLEIDPVRLARTAGRARHDFSLGQYVNDRSYAASSLLGVALADVFSTARAGRCRSRQELADSAIELVISLPALPCRGGAAIADVIFAPLGWHVDARPVPLDDQHPEWGDSRYLRLTLTGTVRLADALNQLYVLLPVLDEDKHYWQGPDEVDKLVRSGSGWLAGHPERELITRRYLSRQPAFAETALARLAEVGGDVPEPANPEEGAGSWRPLSHHRYDAVATVLAELGATSVIDLGCGAGQFLARLAGDRAITRLTGTDVSVGALRAAGRRLGLTEPDPRGRVSLFQAALTYRDARLAGYDAAVLMEVIEHVDPSRLGALEQVVFAGARPKAVIITTPNADYNVRYEDMIGMRHPDHRFEWGRAEFARWSERVAAEHGYRVTVSGVGDTDPEHGAPTQLGVFRRG